MRSFFTKNDAMLAIKSCIDFTCDLFILFVSNTMEAQHKAFIF